MATAFNTRALLRASPNLRQLCLFRGFGLRTVSQQLKNYPKYRHNFTLNKNIEISRCVLVRFYTNKYEDDKPTVSPHKKLTLVQRFKQMYRDYWYVLLPVHLVTSAFWFGGFYYLAKSGVDIVAILESWNISERIINPLKDSSMGYIAVSYALYKIFTPLRYTVTLGGTTISIKYLKEWGYIKPVPSTQELRDMYEEKRNNIIESMKETRTIYKERKDNLKQQMKDTKEGLFMKKEELKTKKEDFMGDFESTLKSIKEETKKIEMHQKPTPVLRNLKETKKTKD